MSLAVGRIQGNLDELNSRKKQPVTRMQKVKQLPYLRRDGELVWVPGAFQEGRDFPRRRKNWPSLS